MMKCKSDRPYPLVQVEGTNREYAKLLLEDYAGVQSEESAVHLYLYQSLLKGEDMEEFAKTMMEISEVEMHHLFLLGQAINLLGVEPVFGTISKDEYFVPWTSSNVSYVSDLKSMIEVDIAREEGAIKNYELHKRMIDDKYIRELIDRIIEDERIHLAIFYYFYNKFFCQTDAIV